MIGLIGSVLCGGLISVWMYETFIKGFIPEKEVVIIQEEIKVKPPNDYQIFT